MIIEKKFEKILKQLNKNIRKCDRIKIRIRKGR